MAETRLSVGTRPSNTHANPVGARPVAEIHDRVYNHSESDYPIHQLQEDSGLNWIVIGEIDKVYTSTNSYFKVIRQPNGDIYLRLVDIFSSKNRDRPQVSQQPDDHTEVHNV
jgi:hypothetical protein